MRKFMIELTQDEINHIMDLILDGITLAAYDLDDESEDERRQARQLLAERVYQEFTKALADSLYKDIEVIEQNSMIAQAFDEVGKMMQKRLEEK